MPAGNQKSLNILTPPAWTLAPREFTLAKDPLERWAPKVHSTDKVFGDYAEKLVGSPPRIDKELSKASSMLSFHYETMMKTALMRDAKGVNDIPEKSIGAIPGYSGFIPRRDAANVLVARKQRGSASRTNSGGSWRLLGTTRGMPP